MAAQEQERAVPTQVWLSIQYVAALAGVNERILRRRATQRSWRGSRLEVREAHGPGGAGGKRYEVLLSSLPVKLQAQWHRQLPGHELREKVAEHAAALEDDPGPRGKKRKREIGRAHV